MIFLAAPAPLDQIVEWRTFLPEINVQISRQQIQKRLSSSSQSWTAAHLTPGIFQVSWSQLYSEVLMQVVFAHHQGNGAKSYWILHFKTNVITSTRIGIHNLITNAMKKTCTRVTLQIVAKSRNCCNIYNQLKIYQS